MKFVSLAIILFFAATVLMAQNSVDTLVSSSKVQKKIFIVRKSEAKESFKIYEEPVTDIQKLDSDLPKKAFKSLPKMVSDKAGLLNQAYLKQTIDSLSFNFEAPHVIMSITISEFGYISKIVVHGYSDRKLVDIIINKFDATHWKAAKDANGKNSDYTFHKIAVVMPVVIKPEERED